MYRVLLPQPQTLNPTPHPYPHDNATTHACGHEQLDYSTAEFTRVQVHDEREQSAFAAQHGGELAAALAALNARWDATRHDSEDGGELATNPRHASRHASRGLPCFLQASPVMILHTSMHSTCGTILRV